MFAKMLLLILMLICFFRLFIKGSFRSKITRRGRMWSRRRAAQNLIIHNRIKWKLELHLALERQKLILGLQRGGFNEESSSCGESESNYSSYATSSNSSVADDSEQTPPSKKLKMSEYNSRRNPRKKRLNNQQREKQKRRVENLQRNKEKRRRENKLRDPENII